MTITFTLDSGDRIHIIDQLQASREDIDSEQDRNNKRVGMCKKCSVISIFEPFQNGSDSCGNSQYREYITEI